MKLRTIGITVAFCGFMFTVAFGQTADTLYHSGSILIMAANDPAYVEALAVRDGKIVFVGARNAALKMKGDSTWVVDLSGKALLASFTDGHRHDINSLLVANQCKLYAPPSGVGKDVPSIIAKLKRYAAEHTIPKGEMIMGYGYDDTVMPKGRLLNRDDLDQAFPDNPVRIEHVTMHGAVLNSLALKYCEISAETETPPGGVIVSKTGTKEPWGLMMEPIEVGRDSISSVAPGYADRGDFEFSGAIKEIEFHLDETIDKMCYALRCHRDRICVKP